LIKALAEKGGVIQICFVSPFLKKEKPHPRRDKELAELRQRYMELQDTENDEVRRQMWKEYREIYAKYPRDKAALKDLVDHIDYVVDLVGVKYVGIGTDYDGGGDIEGVRDVSEMSNITTELLRRGYSEEDIRKIWGGNIMRVFSEVITQAGDSQVSE
jgi:membrane dipeptidase